MELSIYWASMYGTAENVANNMYSLAELKGLNLTIKELNELSIDELYSLKNLAIITSTTGDGDVPSNGENFWEELEKLNLNLDRLNYGVCALGDSSYATFCGAGKKIDEKLQSLNANKIIDRAECDGDDEDSEEWIKLFLEKIT